MAKTLRELCLAGFNGGDPYNAGTDAGVAVLNTHVCTAMSLLTWVILDMAYFKRPSIIGAVQGIITGLVAITPAAGKSFAEIPRARREVLTAITFYCD